MALETAQIQGIIWDLDNTLYRFTDEFITACNVAAAKAAQNLGIELSYEDTLKLAERSEAEHGYSMHGYVTDHGLSYADLHFPFHQNIDETVVEPIAGAIEALEVFQGRQVILTNASRCWAERILKYVGIDHLFEDQDIIPMEDVGFKAKASNDQGYLKGVELLNFKPEEVLMVDDLDRNLKQAKSVGLHTVYMHHGDPMPELPDFIDDQSENLVSLINFLG